MPRDYYDVLGVPRDADEGAIKKAFRQKARELHPDVNESPNAEEEFKEVAAAYEVLCDPQRRASRRCSGGVRPGSRRGRFLPG